jgi:opacity protein-like surface antigen
MKRLLAVAVLTVLALAAAAGAATDPPRLILSHQIGNVGIGMSRARVIYTYGNGRTAPGDIHVFRVSGGILVVSFYRGHVNFVGTTSGRYRTADGLGVGSTIPFGSCHGNGTSCVHRWNGFTFSPRKSFWFRPFDYGGRRVLACLYVTRGTVTTLALLDQQGGD